MRLPRPSDAEARNQQALRLHRSVPQGDCDHVGEGASRDLPDQRCTKIWLSCSFDSTGYWVGWANYFRYLRARGAFDCDNF